jgi:hypothetical protein
MVFEIPPSDQNAFQIPQEDQIPETSALGAAGRGALDALPFGTKGAAAVEAGLGQDKYEQYLKELDALLAADKESHPVAHIAGETAGSVAPFLVPGVGEALGAESLAGRAGVGAGIGALQAASNTRAPLQSPEGLQDVLKGAGAGAVLNPAIGGVGDLLGGLGSKLAESEIPQRLSAASFSKANGLNPMALRKLAQMEGLNPEQAANEFSSKLSDIVPDNYYSPMSSVNDKHAILGQLKQKAGDIMGLSRQGATEAEGPALEEGQKAIDELVSKAQNYKDVANPEGADTIKNAAAMLQTLKDKGQLNFDTLQAIKSKVGENYQNLNNIKPGTDEIYSTLSDHLDKALERLAPSNPNVDPAAFKQAKEVYALTSKIMPLMVKGAGREVMGALTPMKSALGLGALATGHPLAAAATAGKAVQEIAAPQLGANLAMSGKAALGNIPSLSTPSLTNTALQTTKIPPQYRQVFQQATQGLTDPAEIQKKTVVTDFVMQSRNPAYVAAKQQMGQ